MSRVVVDEVEGMEVDRVARREVSAIVASSLSVARSRDRQRSEVDAGTRANDEGGSADCGTSSFVAETRSYA